jgi:hypothetical protein
MNRRNFLSAAAASAGLGLVRPIYGKKTGSAALSPSQTYLKFASTGRLSDDLVI